MRKIFLLLILILGFIFPAFAADNQSSSENSSQASDDNYQNELNKMVADSNKGIKNVQDMIKQLVSSNSADLPAGGEAKDFYQKGLELTEAGKLEEARLYFDKAVQLSDSAATTEKINKAQERLRIQDKALGDLKEAQLHEQQEKQKEFEQTTENIYQKAVGLYRQKNYLLARESFNNVEKLVSNYKSTQTYLDDINKTLAKQDAEALEHQKAQEELQQKQAEEARVKEEKAKQAALEQQRKEAEVAKQKQDEDQKRQELEKQKQEHLEALRKENEEKEQLRKTADANYNSALDLYRAQKYQEAIDKFQEVNKSIPSYKSTDRYIKKSQQQLTKQQKRQEDAARKQAQEQKIEEQKKQKALEQQRKEEQEAAQKQEQEQKIQEQKKVVDQLKTQEEENKQKAEVLRQQNEVEAARIKVEQEKQRVLELQRKQEETLAEKQAEEQKIQEQKKIVEQLKEQAEQNRQKAEELRKQNESEEVRIKEEKERQRILEKQSKQDAQDAKNKLEEQDRQRAEADRKIQEAKDKEAKEDLAGHQDILIKEKLAKDQVRKQVESIYNAGVDFYRGRQYLEAKDKFLAVRSQLPGYQASERYLRKIDSIMAEQKKREERKKQEVNRKQLEHNKWLETHKPKQEVPTQQQVVQPEMSETPAASVAAVATTSPQTKEEQEQEARMLSDLAQKSSELYRQISDLADDRSTVIAKDKLGKVDAVLNNLKNQKEKVLMQQKEQEQKQKAILYHKQIEEAYDEAVNLLRSKNYDEAKKKFLEVEGFEQNYRGTRSYLIKIDRYQRKAQQESLAERSRSQEKIAQERRLEEEKKARQEEAQQKAREEQEKQAKIAQHKQQLAEIAKKAALINDEILHMTTVKDYAGAKVKFTELESVMADLKAAKEAIAQDQNIYRTQAQLDNQKNSRVEKVIREKHLEKAKNENDQEIIQRQRYKDFEDKKIQAYKEQEIRRQHEIMFKQASNLYDSGKYGEARIILSELASEGDRRAPAFIKKIDRILEQSVVKANKEEGRKRSDYINEQRYKQKMKDEEQAQEQAQRRLFKQQLEHQKEMAEQERQNERRHLEALKMQEKERQKIEDKRKLSEEQSKDKEEAYHFRKVPPALLTFSDKSKDKMLPDADKWKFAQVNKKIEKIPSKVEPIVAKEPEQKPQEKSQENHVEQEEAPKGLLGRMFYHKTVLTSAEKPQEKITADKVKIEVSPEANKEMIERQKRLEEDRKSTKAAFENGVEVMYKEAVKLYKSGDYKAASKRFTDIQDLIPNYKDSKDYMDKALKQQNVVVPIPVAPAVVVPAPSVVQVPQPVVEQTPQQTSVEQEAPQGLFGLFHHKLQAHKQQEVKVVQTPSKVDAFARENAIAKTLDLFDSNPK